MDPAWFGVVVPLAAILVGGAYLLIPRIMRMRALQREADPHLIALVQENSMLLRRLDERLRAIEATLNEIG